MNIFTSDSYRDWGGIRGIFDHLGKVVLFTQSTSRRWEKWLSSRELRLCWTENRPGWDCVPHTTRNANILIMSTDLVILIVEGGALLSEGGQSFQI